MWASTFIHTYPYTANLRAKLLFTSPPFFLQALYIQTCTHAHTHTHTHKHTHMHTYTHTYTQTHTHTHTHTHALTEHCHYRGEMKAWRIISQLANESEIAISQLESSLARFLSNCQFQQKIKILPSFFPIYRTVDFIDIIQINPSYKFTISVFLKGVL